MMHAMTDTPPTEQPPSAYLGTSPPYDGWPSLPAEFYRNRLLKLLDEANERATELGKRHDELVERTDKELAELREKIPDVGENPTLVEWLTRRAAQVDYDLAESEHDEAIGKALLEFEKAEREYYELEAQLGYLDNLLESGEYAAGNQIQVEVLGLAVDDAALDIGYAAAKLELAQRKHALIKRLHREVHTALRKAQRAERSQKKR